MIDEYQMKQFFDDSGMGTRDLAMAIIQERMQKEVTNYYYKFGGNHTPPKFSDTKIIGMQYCDRDGNWHFVKAREPIVYMSAETLNSKPELFQPTKTEDRCMKDVNESST